MKIAHFADTHFREYGKFEPTYHLHSRTIDYLDSMDMMIDTIIAEEVDIVVFAGDAFHTHNPNQNLLYLFAENISKIAQHCPIVMIPGNHDMPGPSYKASSIDVLSLEIPGVTIANEYKNYMIETKSGNIQISAFPFPMRQHILSEGDLRRSKKDTWVKYKDEVSKRLQELSGSLDKSFPSILIGHFIVSGASFQARPGMLVDDEVEVNLVELAEGGWDYVALGHLHNHQEVFDDPPIVYSGSLDRVSFLDEHQDKGFVMIDIPEDGEVSWEFISVDARIMVTIDMDVTGTKTPMESIISKIEEYDVQGAIVRVRIECDSVLYVDKLEVGRKLEEMDMYELHGISITVPRVISSRLDSDRPASSYTEMEMIEIFFTDTDEEEYEVLENLAEEIMEEVHNE